MSHQKVTDEQWAAARKRYETEPGLGLGKIAQVLDCSKSLVARKAREEKWQKDQGVPSQVQTPAQVRDSKFTESAVQSETQAVHLYEPGASTQPARVVADVYVPPSAAQAPQQPQSNDYADEIRIPDGLDEVDREEFVKAAIVARQRAINARHLKELNAARSKLYESLRKAGTKEVPDGAGIAAERGGADRVASRRNGSRASARPLGSRRVRRKAHEADASPHRGPCAARRATAASGRHVRPQRNRSN